MKKKKKLGNNDTSTYYDEYKNYKNSVKNFCTDTYVLGIINDMCIRTNTIMRHATYFVKLYFNYLFENNMEFPVINVDFMRYVYTFVSTINSNRITKISEKKMIKFNVDIFSKINLYKESRDGMTNILSYESEIYVTNVENNIRCHFYSHFSKYVNVLFNFLERINEIKKLKISDNDKNKKVSELKKELYDIKIKILSDKNIEKTEKYREKMIKIRKDLFSDISNIHENGIAYDVHIQPQKYLYSMYTIIKEYEKMNNDNKNKPNYMEIKLFNVLPMRTTLIPRNITIDTEIIIQNFKEILKKNTNIINKNCKNIEELRTNFCKNNMYNEIWSALFNMKNKFFKDKNKYEFNYLLKTNGISCSAQFKLKKKHEANKKPKMKSSKKKEEFKYIDDMTKQNKFEILTKKNVACIDPNKRDLMYCGTYVNNKFKHFIYTQLQRRKEMQTENHKKIRKELGEKIIKKKKTNGKNVKWRKEDDKTLKEYELKKCEYSIKSICVEKMKKNIGGQEKINIQIKKNYEENIYRKLEWNAYINREKSESKMIKNFKERIGDKKNTVVLVGDYSVNAKNLRGTLPAISKRILTIFKKFKYEVYVIDEYCTSKLCNECGSENEMFHKRKSQKPKIKGKKELVHGLLRCKSSKCKIIHNRDKNAVKNMLKIAEDYKNKRERSKIYCRN